MEVNICGNHENIHIAFMNKSEIKFIITSFLIWRISLFVILYFAIRLMPFHANFLGGGSGNYLTNPYFWAWGNFDGQHYVNIAQNGYGFGEYTFFPFYPLVIRLFGFIFGDKLLNLNFIGQVISNISFLIGLVGFYKLARIDFSEKVARLSVVLLLLFPTSFYFAGVYTESLFFALLVWAFYFIRLKKYLPGSILGALLTFSRPVGIFVLPAFFCEWLVQNWHEKNKIKKLPFNLILIPTGLFSYMFYLKNHLNDAFAFFSEQVYVGEHRSSHIILLPQILYRYIFKIFPNQNINYFPGIFFTFLEFFIGVGYVLLIAVLFYASRLSYAVFALLAYLTPTFLGSFSSMPRYVLIIFPVYLVLAQYLSKSKTKLFAFCLISSILLIISFALYSRGFWIS